MLPMLKSLSLRNIYEQSTKQKNLKFFQHIEWFSIAVMMEGYWSIFSSFLSIFFL